MTKNELANISSMTDEQIMKAIGQDDGTSTSDGIPRLSINRNPEDDNGNNYTIDIGKCMRCGKFSANNKYVDFRDAEIIVVSPIILLW